MSSEKKALHLKRIPPAVVLFVLAPVIGELVSGSSPPMEFFNPLIFLLLAGLYGSGALVTRELKIRWHKDVRSLFLLGCAYAVLEEGLMVKSFFDPNWMDLNEMSWHGRWLEVNWVWTEMLTIYHAVSSIIIPIALTELAYPEQRNESWIGKRTFAALTVVLFFETLIGLFALTTYIPPAPQYLLAIAAMALFILAAYKLKPKKTSETPRKTASPKLLFAVCAAGSTLFFIMFWSSPTTLHDYPIAAMILGLVLVFAFGVPVTIRVDKPPVGHEPARSGFRWTRFHAVSGLHTRGKRSLGHVVGQPVRNRRLARSAQEAQTESSSKGYISHRASNRHDKLKAERKKANLSAAG